MAQILEIKKLNDQEINDLILEVLYDFQALDITHINLPQSCGYADMVMIATGRSSRQMCAIADTLKKRISPHISYHIQIEGLAKAEWVLIDIGHVIVHLFKPEMREFYQLEKLWDHD